MKQKTTLKIALIAIILISFSFIVQGCNNSKQSSSKSGKSKNTLTIITYNRIKSSGFLKRIIPAFEQENKCKIELITFNDSSELMEFIHNEKDNRKYDIALGLDNCFFTDAKDFSLFSVSNALLKHPVNSNCLFDSEHQLIPYGYGYLAILYNELKQPQPPESFGELQDARFLNQLVVCDPRKSGIGRATLYWTIALFGNEGYQQFWKSIKKNIYGSNDNWQDAMQTLELQEANMTFGFTNTPAWYLENKTNPLPIKASLMKEGSFLYVETAAINKRSKHKSLSDVFLTYLLSPVIQKYVAYDLGLFPANESAPLPNSFISVPFTSYTVNDKLIEDNPQINVNSWLDFWDRLFSNRIY